MALFGGSKEGGMLEGLKSRLGFGGEDEEGSRSFRRTRNDDYDDYDDGYEDEYDDEFDDGYDGYDDYPIQDDYSGGYGNADQANARSAWRDNPRTRPGDFPPLVSIEDVKAQTQVPDRLRRDPLASTSTSTGRTSYARVGERTVLDETIPPESSPAHNAALRDSRLHESSRSDGLNSLFEPTTPSSYDPYEAYSSRTPSSHTPLRSLSVLKPASYAEVERIAKVVRAGDVVVLVLRNTPDQLAKRILDFSFGVSSALEANVECPAEKVFAIAKGNGLTDDEKARLRSQGVL